MVRSKSLMVVIVLLIAVAAAGCSTASGFTKSSVTICEKELVIPTYMIGKPDPNPRFYEGRAYQGAQGRVYPYPMLDRLTDRCEDKAYNAVYLENEYVKICVLPEIGGRVFEAVDKTNGFDFLYRQHVIKPALIGMIGAWISGGIEWNFPHHHRASVFLPMDYVLKDNPDGSKTIWMSEIEMRHRMKLVIGITLRPGKSYFEAEIKLYNRSPFVHSFLYWANVSVYADENYQVIFPPSTQFAVYHGKNAFVRWPVSHETYRDVDYTKGVDMSWWKNHPSPMSFFAWNYKDDFLAGYDHKKGAGTAYVANHHVAPGKKFWQWGPGPHGRIWDKILTDEDGPYVELMVGAYSDNQPDYSWLQPYEGKSIRQYWYPIRDIGGVKNANLVAAVNMEVTDKNTVKIGFNATAEYKNAKVLLGARGKVVFKENIDIGPGKPFIKEVSLTAGIKETDLRVSLVSASGEELVAYQPAKMEKAPMPEVVKRPPDPNDIKTVEELCLTGMRLEQFYNPSLSPVPYYEEALKRDPGNSRVNVALGILYLKWHMFEKAEEHFRVALKRLTKDYTSPKDGEAYYYLGWVLKLRGKLDAAYDALYKAAWSHAFHTAAYFHLAEIDCMRGEFETALKHLDRSLVTNAWHAKALNLKAAVLRRLGRPKEASELAKKVSADDPLNLWSLHEAYLAGAAMGLEKEQIAELRENLEPKWNVEVPEWHKAQTCLEIAVDYANAGLWDEAIDMLNLIASSGEKRATTYPMVFYYLGYFHEKKEDVKKAAEYYRIGGKMPTDYCFPFRAESIHVLRAAFRNNSKDGRAHCYLGNLFYDRQPKKAIKEWEKARELDAGIATLHRNLARGYFQIEHNVAKAIASMEKAIECDQDPGLFYELDVLYETGGVSMQKRLDLLIKNHKYIRDHNDAFSREIVLLTQLGHYDKAIKMMMPPNHFRRWEGLGNIHSTYLNAHLLRARKHLKDGRYGEAVKDYEAALEYPENLEVARPHHGGQDCEVYCLLGNAYDAWGNAEKAREFYEKSATAKRHESRSALDFYQGMAYMKLGRKDKAAEMFDALIKHSEEKLESLKMGTTLEFFAKFGKKRSVKDQQADALYLMGLGYIGKGDVEAAKQKLEEALRLNPNHIWAKTHLEDLLASCANTPVRTVHVNEKPGDGAFSLVRTKIEVPIVDFEDAVFHDKLGYPRIDTKKFDRNNPGKVIKPFEAVVLENKYARLTLIPGMGKPYSFIYKVTGHEEFFIPTVAQVPTSPNNLKWWFALGGVEYTMPDNEHGETWAATWEWEIAEDSSAKKTVRMKVKELRHGLLETIDISMYPDKAFYEAVISIKNPTEKPVEFQHWINPMWVPGGRGEITPHTEFVIPTRQVYIDKRRFNDWMLDYHPEKSRTQSFDGPLRFLMGWKGIGDLLACKLEHGYYSAFSHDEDEGIVRVFPKDKCPGCNIWAWGINPQPGTRKHFSGSEKCRGYVEMWGGITHGFAEYYRLEPGASISWTEWMYPYHLTKGLHYANEDFAATFTRLADGKHVLRLCPAGDLTGVECKAVTVGSNRTCLHVVYDSIYPKKKLPQFTCPETKEKLELIILKGGKEIIRLSAKRLPEFPGEKPPPR